MYCACKSGVRLFQRVRLFWSIENHGKIFLNYFQTITLDGGEFRSLAGEFNKLRMVPPEMWDMMEKMIRSTNKKSKA